MPLAMNGANLKLGGLVFIIVTSLHLSSAFAQLPQVTTGTCNVTRMSYVTSNARTSTPIITNIVNLPDMLVHFDVAEGQCLNIEFSLTLAALAMDNIQLRALF